VRTDEFARHDLYVPRDAAHPHPVITNRANDSGDVCAVAVVIHGIRVMIHGIDAVAVVDVAIVIVVDAVVVAVRRAGINVVGEVRVVVVDPRVDQSDVDTRITGRDVPSRGGINVGTGDGVRDLARVLQRPLAREARIVRYRADRDDVVGLGILYVALRRIGGDCILHGGAWREPDSLQAGYLAKLMYRLNLDAVTGTEHGESAGSRGGAKFHQQLDGHRADRTDRWRPGGSLEDRRGRLSGEPVVR